MLERVFIFQEKHASLSTIVIEEIKFYKRKKDPA